MKISFCTTCKNRLFHLKQTLPISIINSSDYFDREFIILDYNSEDGLYEWAKSNLLHWEKAGVVKYLRTRKPQYFSAAHAKNIAHKNATGDILCNLDCDNFVTKGLCQQISRVFKEPKVIFCSQSQDIFGNHGCCGKIASTKETFYSVNGYDESEEICMGWGWDDVNFRYRAEKHNNLKLVYGDIKYNLVLSHDNSVRTQNFAVKDIKKTEQASIKFLEKLAENKRYIANTDKNWGFVDDLKIGLNS